MCRIKIKNFGPIKEGFQENEGWMDIAKVTLLIGNQGSGKSTIAKLIATFMWLEKAIIRGDFEMFGFLIQYPIITHERFLEMLEYHKIENYWKSDTVLEYESENYTFRFKRAGIDEPVFEIKFKENSDIHQPKIMYVPAERNVFSAIDNIAQVSDMVHGSSQTFLIEYRKSQFFEKGIKINLPINNAQVVYESREDQVYVVVDSEKIKLSHASSGFQSIIPLFLTTRYLNAFIKQKDHVKIQKLSADLQIRREKQLQSLPKSKDLMEHEANFGKINKLYLSDHLVNIVEEPEQNLFPSSQKQLLFSLLDFNNENERNKLIMTTHSPYLLMYLSVCIQAGYIKNKINNSQSENKEEFLNKMNLISPVQISENEVLVYQFDEENGTIKKLETMFGIPSDDNFLNNKLAEGNLLFDSLLELEQEL